ncbi:MAG: DMT family transporter [Candidatus Omnitrophica bacterium]|nr:DMT family transporter [Candidatus Omnitrophota bacterium]
MSSRGSIHWFGTLVLLGAIFCWSLIPPMLKVFTSLLDGWTTNGVRYPFASLLLIFPLLYEYRHREVDRRIWMTALIPTAFNVIAQVSWSWIPYYLDATRMGFFVRISVVFSILGGFVCFPEERGLMKHPFFWLGVIGCFLGITIMSFGGEAVPEGASLVGILLALGCGASYGLYAVAVRYSLKGARPWVAFPVISFYTSSALLVFMLIEGQPAQLCALTVPQWLLLLLSAVIGIGAAHTLYYIAIERLGVAISSSTQLVAPFLTSYWSYLALGEMITLTQWIGGIILFLGGVVVILSQTSITAEAFTSEALVEPDAPD